MDSILEVITNFNNEFLHCNTDTPVDALWNKFKDICHVCLHKIPSKVVNINTRCPWINQSIRRLTCHKQKAYNQARSNQSAESWAEYQSLKKEAQRQCRRTYNVYVQSLVNPKAIKKRKSLSMVLYKNQTERPLWSFNLTKR